MKNIKKSAQTILENMTDERALERLNQIPFSEERVGKGFINTIKSKMVKSDLKQLDGMYYVGHLIDMDGSGYVDEETAELILLEYNNGVRE